ncbi:MAG: L,D-transpeptidase [Thermoanaerobaculia bacterium]
MRLSLNLRTSVSISPALAVFVAVVALVAFAPSVAVSTERDAPTSKLRIIILKKQRRLEVYSSDTLLRTYRIGLGLNPKRPKERQGDNATPEGSFYVCVKNASSKYYRSLGLSYPGPADAERGLRSGLVTNAQRTRILSAHRHRTTPPWNTRLGGEIFIHGRGSQSDWTWGCVALDDADMAELFAMVPLGTEVVIRP